ncbi:hypothetical protein MH215_23965 [Paenibacillus sp. ACRSA]|uniref:hypothetical protein n=1 Tax=Paenibacillus sp. ACRSA TaxID=2918211 RepID=UPI001EF6469B|nr:hypothetical protein [Paenibacillus sp. ACRSA]MCG7380055.1 hypothetical protein [Paenibacillus sp. ACRSA]
MLSMFDPRNMSTKEKVLFALNPSVYLINKGAEKAVEKIQGMSESPVSELQIETARQELLSQMAQAQARVAQELAIATRINTAETVEIEEFYDTSGKGGLSATINEGSITGGVTGEGRKVTKRIYKFTGWHEGAKEVFESQLNNEKNE